MASNLSTAELLKRPFRFDVMIRKIKEGSPFKLVNGSMVNILNVPAFIAELEAAKKSGTASNKLKNMTFLDKKTGKVYRLSDLAKTDEFGGKGAGSGTAKEDRALSSLREQMNAAKKQHGLGLLPIKVGSKVYMVDDVESTHGTPKSDFHLTDAAGKEIVWISHKDGKTERDFQQWGGVSPKGEPKLHNHPEVQHFMKQVQAMFPDGISPATTVIKKIKDKKLKMMSVYGNEFGGPFSRQNVTLMLQGDVLLKKVGSHFVIEAFHTHLNGEEMTGGYEPVLLATFKGDRSDLGIKGARAGISPYNSRRATNFYELPPT